MTGTRIYERLLLMDHDDHDLTAVIDIKHALLPWVLERLEDMLREARRLVELHKKWPPIWTAISAATVIWAVSMTCALRSKRCPRT